MSEMVEMKSSDGGVFKKHVSAFVDAGAAVGEGTSVWHFCHVQTGAKVGPKCSLGQNVYVGATAELGRNVKVQNNVSIYDRVIIEDDAFCGPSMVFTNVINPRSFIVRKHEYRETRVKQGASIGANATIVCGVTVGRYAFVGAGAVVNRDVPDYALMLGVPAKWSAWMCWCGVRMPNADAAGRVVCAECGRTYQEERDASPLGRKLMEVAKS